MATAKEVALQVQGTEITVVSNATTDYISLTDMARRFGDDTLIYQWMRNRNSVEFLGVWEQLHNPDLKGGEFETFKNPGRPQPLSPHPQQWRDANPTHEGNMREYASVEQLLVFANIESMNAELIHMRLSQRDRVTRLNRIAIRQMRVLTTSRAGRQLTQMNEADRLSRA